jgi:RNA polymerase subunit RPABC4/transcription elongation factor Spt4
MSKIGLLSAMILVCFIACKKEEVKLNNTALKASSPLIKSTTFATDWSGTVVIAIVSAEASGSGPTVDVNVPDGFTLVGGGAVVTPQFTLPGALLTASYPDSNYTTWHAASHDHLFSFPHTLTAYAIGIKLADLTRNDLVTNMNIFSTTSGSASHPGTIANITDFYTLLGGGAKVNPNPEGNFLVASMPLINGWYVESKDHDVVSAATINAYAIGIKTQLLENGQWETATYGETSFIESGFGTDTVNFDNTYVLSCPGASTTYDGAGRMLNFVQPYVRSAVVGSQDLLYTDAGILNAFGVGIRKKLK